MNNEVDKAIALNIGRYKGRTVTDFGQVFTRALLKTRVDVAQLPGYAKFAKLQEEAGEFGEACLQVDGYVRKDKQGVGTPIEEASDIILQVLDILGDMYSDIPADRLVAGLEFELMRKLLKWEKKMTLSHMMPSADFPEGYGS